MIRSLIVVTALSLAASGAALAQTKTGPAKAAPEKSAPAPDKAAQEKAAQEKAAVPKQLGEAQAWKAYAYREKGEPVCYVAADPAKSEPKRGKPIALVTHRPGEKLANVVSFVIGQPLRKGSDAELDIDGKKFVLFTNNDTAWAKDSTTDKQVVEAMVKGKQATIKGTNERGAAVTDTYDLAGFTQAIGFIDRECKVKR